MKLKLLCSLPRGDTRISKEKLKKHGIEVLRGHRSYRRCLECGEQRNAVPEETQNVIYSGFKKIYLNSSQAYNPSYDSEIMYMWPSLYALLQSSFCHNRGFITVSWRTLISYPQPDFKVFKLRLYFSRPIRKYDADDKLRIKEFWSQFNDRYTLSTLRLFSVRGHS